MKTWARWTLVTVWFVILLLTCTMWNPFVSFNALLKYSVLSIYSAVVFGAAIILIQFYILLTVIFPLPPRADSKASKPFGQKFFPFLYKDPPINPKAPKTLDELIGNEQAKLEIREVIDMLMNPSKYKESGADVPKGMLFVGSPGVGKTLFARAVANEVGVPFYVVEGGAISGLFFGLGVLKLKTLFAKLRRHDRSILFIDEIDSMASRRQQDRGFGGVADMNMTLNTLLTEMDGFHGSRLMVIGATNNDGMLDPALMRSGRMDRRIYFQMPLPAERKELFRYYLSKVQTDPNIDLDELVMLTASSSPADIANVVNEAALVGQRPGGPGKVTTDVVKQALERISIGAEGSIMGSDLEIQQTDPTIRLSDVIGVEDVMQDAAEIIDFLKEGDRLRKIGAKVPRGILMIGPPGVGKTMLAKAIANEAGVPFFGISAARLKGSFTGSGRIRALYSQARKSPAAIVFIDEIDALAGTMTDIGNERTSELNQILIELDGMSSSRNVITIGATNQEQNLDPAFMRSGRFDRKVYVGLPDAPARKKIFEKYLSTIKLSAVQPDLDKLAKRSVNFSGADISATVNEAAMLAVRRGKDHVDEADLEEAVDKVSVTAGHKLNTSGISMARVPDIEVKLSDIKGMDEGIAEAAEVVAILKNMHLLEDTGLKAPKGILLVGQPGTGKTMLAKAIANEAGVAFYACVGCVWFLVWVGLGAQRVRAVYEQARRSGKPAIVFIDEIDSIGHHRGVDWGAGGKQEHNQTLNQFLVELDGFGKHKVLTIGATNNPSLLDPALLRPGRFDRQIHIPLPNLEGRESILSSYIKKAKVKDVDVLEIARMTMMSSGADLANIVNEAGLIAVRAGKREITQPDLLKAVQRVMMGMSYSRHILIDELRATAYHEAGHALVCYYRNRRERIQILTIVPSGGALGYLWHVEKEDYVQKNKHEYLVDIEVGLGGYAAESLHMETTTSGVSSDLSSVARIARHMIRHWGMGTHAFNVDIAYTDREHDGSRSGMGMSGETLREIELEIKKVVDSCHENVQNLLRTHRAELDRLAHALLEKETLYYKDIVRILEPQRSEHEIDEEIASLAERRLVGTPPVINLHHFGSVGGNGSNGGNGHGSGAPVATNTQDSLPAAQGGAFYQTSPGAEKVDQEPN